jgi:hypothetical protein
MHTLYMHQHVSTRMTKTRARWNKDESSPRKNGNGIGISHFPSAGIDIPGRTAIVGVTGIVVFNLLSACR